MYGDEGPAEMDTRESAAKVMLRDRDRPPVERELDRVAQGVSDLDEAVGELHRRLGAVLGPDRPEPALGEVRQSEDLSPLSARLMEEGDRLASLNRALRGLLRRIEL